MMDPYFIEELYYWKHNLNYIEVQECFFINKPQHFAYCDASVTGCSSVISLDEDYVCHKLWEPSESLRSSTWRKRDLESFAPVLAGSHVKRFTDSQAAARIIELENMELGLHRLALTISQFCAEHSFRLEVQWFPRTESEKKDYISHLVDFDDWQITRDFFISLKELWGPHTLDSFRISGAWVCQGLTSLRKI